MCFKMSSYGFSFFLLPNGILVIIFSIFLRLMTSCIIICNLLLNNIPKDAGAQASHETSLFHDVFTPKKCEIAGIKGGSFFDTTTNHLCLL